VVVSNNAADVFASFEVVAAEVALTQVPQSIGH
jgi:hypothetical protein